MQGPAPFPHLMSHQFLGLEPSKSSAVSWLRNFHFQDCGWIKATRILCKDSSRSL